MNSQIGIITIWNYFLIALSSNSNEFSDKIEYKGI